MLGWYPRGGCGAPAGGSGGGFGGKLAGAGGPGGGGGGTTLRLPLMVPAEACRLGAPSMTLHSRSSCTSNSHSHSLRPAATVSEFSSARSWVRKMPRSPEATASGTILRVYPLGATTTPRISGCGRTVHSMPTPTGHPW